MLTLAAVECVHHASSAPARVALRRVFLGFLGPLFVVLLLPVYDFRWVITFLSIALVAPLVFISVFFAAVVAIMLPFFGFQSDLIVGAAHAFGYVLAIGVCSLGSVYLLAWIRPGLGHVLKVLLDILLYVGDSKFRENAHAALETAIASARERSPDGIFVVVAHSLGSVIALESLLTSRGWKEGDQIVFATMGSPIRRFFWRFFPDYMFHGTPSVAAKFIARRFREFRWVNVYRPFDQIGSALGFSTSCAARDRSTGQLNLVLSAHVNYWSDETVISNLRDMAEFAARIPAATDFSPAAAPPSTGTDMATPVRMLPGSTAIRLWGGGGLILRCVCVDACIVLARGRAGR
jgi:hypothetical protein